MSSNNNAIEQNVTIEASKATVYEALTDPNGLIRWFPTQAESDPRPGGKLRLEWEFADADQNGFQEGTYQEVIANKMITYPWRAGEVPTTVAFTLEEAEGETTVNLVHSGFGSAEDAEGLRAAHDGPWSFYMFNLKSYLEQGVDMRTEKLSQVTRQ